jgi:hypothetical protein
VVTVFTEGLVTRDETCKLFLVLRVPLPLLAVTVEFLRLIGSFTLHVAELVSISLLVGGSSATYCESFVVLVSLRLVVVVA